MDIIKNLIIKKVLVPQVRGLYLPGNNRNINTFSKSYTNYLWIFAGIFAGIIIALSFIVIDYKSTIIDIIEAIKGSPIKSSPLIDDNKNNPTPIEKENTIPSNSMVKTIFNTLFNFFNSESFLNIYNLIGVIVLGIITVFESQITDYIFGFFFDEEKSNPEPSNQTSESSNQTPESPNQTPESPNQMTTDNPVKLERGKELSLSDIVENKEKLLMPKEDNGNSTTPKLEDNQETPQLSLYTTPRESFDGTSSNESKIIAERRAMCLNTWFYNLSPVDEQVKQNMTSDNAHTNKGPEDSVLETKKVTDSKIENNNNSPNESSSKKWWFSSKNLGLKSLLESNTEFSKSEVSPSTNDPLEALTSDIKKQNEILKSTETTLKQLTNKEE
jgi:hypothetical protein